MNWKLIFNQKTKNKLKIYTKKIFIIFEIQIGSSVFKKFNAINEKIDLIVFCVLIVRARFESATAVQSSR